MRIIFMGTPDFALPSLKALIEAGHDIAAVYTQPDRPKGRKKRLSPPPVKVFAEGRGLKVLQPPGLRKPEAAGEFSAFGAELCVVAAYGKILPEAFLNAPKFGCINVHASLLPKYRGAAPVQRSIINGERETGITIMHMSGGLDEGDIILQEATAIGQDENAGALMERLAFLGAETLLKALPMIEAGTAPRISQESTGIKPSYAAMLDKNMGLLDFSESAQALYCIIRGLNPWPAAYIALDNGKLKIYSAKLRAEERTDEKPGVLLDEREFLVSCGGGTVLELLRVQAEGKKIIDGAEFLRGRRLKKGYKF
ncbi:MAG: methionyl-tRNA formyltransferase [Oscillospiraceae bacterium]|nr:methionyl-tRNA formyltransferase [Oscillospiraceae bacterium]